ncbi:MAG: hypothetical protein K0R03_59 [Moraxellaceae bacterium]|jgi:hypothetical protein|nr:hypothetical protein [Moraxellaceae bacterium]
MKIRWQVLKGNPEAPLLALDLVVLLLTTIDLLWLLADALLLSTGLGVLAGRAFPAFMAQYRGEWHETLLVYDSLFTVFLVGELLLRWAVAVARRTYHRWFFYPFANWYDVLGSIPLPQFRVLRLLRVVSILYRLHKLGVVDLAESRTFTALRRYYRIVLEELSDRIVVNVLEGVQREIRSGTPLTHRLSENVLQPRRDVIVPWLADLIADTSAHAYGLHRERLAAYLETIVREAVATNPELQRVKRILLGAGPALEDQLQKIISGLLTQTLDQALTDLGQRGNAAVQDVAGGIFDTVVMPHAERDEAIRQIALDILEVVKAQVAVQQWKQQELSTKADGAA